MKKIFDLIVIMLASFIVSGYASGLDIPGRPDIRPLDNRSIVAVVRGFSKTHFGIDFACCVDSEVKATGSGRVILSRYVNGYGNMIIIKHDWVKNGKSYTAYSVYGHLEEFIRLRGQYVDKGDLIALSGNTGRSEGPHLHYELRDSNENPIWNGTYQAEARAGQ